MKRIIPAVIMAAVFLTCAASAYVINFEAPSSVESGTLLVITGTSTLPAGFTTEIQFYKKAQVGNKEVAKIPFTIQNEGKWSVSADTSGWAAGEYTMSIPKNSEYSYGSSSTLLKMFTVTGGTAATTEPTPAAVETKVPTPEETELYQVTPEITQATQQPSPVPTQSGLGPATLISAGVLACAVLFMKKERK